MMAKFIDTFAPGWLTSTITVESWNGTFDSYGNPQYGPPVQVNCYIQDRVRMVRTFQGDERASSCTVYIQGGPLTAHDRITLPSSVKGAEIKPPILWVSNVNDRTGFDHSEVYL